MNIVHTQPTKAIVNIQVKRRAAQPTHGWFEEPKKEVIIPTIEELVFAIYDAQREIIGSMYPKRFNSKIMTPVKNIERIYHMGQHLMDFDGMTHAQATEYYNHAALNVGIRNSFSIPFIFAKKIRVRCAAFVNGYSHVFEMINGLRYQTQGTTHEFHYMSGRRILASNLSYHLNEMYNCNLHIAFDESVRVYEATGEYVAANRALFTEACDYYMHPQLMDKGTFLRAQVKEVRDFTPEMLAHIWNNTDDLIAEAPKLAYEIDRAKAIYNNQIQQWVGDYSDEPIVG